MLKKLLFIHLALLSLCSSAIIAQEKIFTPEEVVGLNPALYLSGFSQLQWVGNEDVYSYSDKKNVIQVDASDGKNDTIFNLSELNKILKISLFDTITRIPQINWIDESKLYYFSQNKLFLFNINEKSVTLISAFPENAQNQNLSLPSMRVAYTIDNNLYVSDGEKHTQITFEPEGVVCGQTVHRNEFGISGGIFWSPDGNKIAFYRMDENMVATYPIVDISERIAVVKPDRYPMTGETSHQVTLGIYDLQNGSTTFMKTGEPKDQYLTSVCWSPDSKSLFTGILNRDQNHLVMSAFDIASGERTKILFEEKDEKYVEPMNPMFFLPDGSNNFLWLSQRDGYLHLYLYDLQGNMIRQITSGSWVVSSFSGFSADGKNIFFLSTKESPIEQNIYTLNIKSAKISRLSSDKGTHRAILSKSGKFVLDVYSNQSTPRAIKLITTKNGKSLNIKTETNPLKDYKLGKTRIFTIPATDGSDLYCRMISPPGMDSTKRYPVVVYVYGGPHSQMITESWLGGANFYLNYLAQKGYIVFTLDNHGTSNRGKAFEQAIFRNVGTIESEDQMLGIAYLKSLPFVDASRIGIDGWSYGGFMSMTLKLQHPDVFKVAIAGGPVIDWKYYEVMYGERYMDTPQTNPDGYAKASLLNQAKNLKGKLLIMHGTEDNTVVWQNSLSFLKQCVDDGILLDYFVYPGHEHNVRGKDRAHLIRKITNYFEENL
ncbi:MAG: S9 family peptidase [Bacteroidales bacterium]